MTDRAGGGRVTDHADGSSGACPAGRPPFRVAAASLSGESDADWARGALPHVGAAFMGGIALDEPTREAARAMVDRERAEFLPDDPVAFVDEQLAALADAPLVPGFNVRAVDPDAVRAAASVCADRDAVLEVNAHCRQDEMCASGAGESLLAAPDRLCEHVEAAAGTGATVSVKVRTEVPDVDLPALAARVADAGADIVHVDAMDSEPVIAEVVGALGGEPGAPDSEPVAPVGDQGTTHRDPGPPGEDGRAAFVVANNGVRGRETVGEYLDYGADAVSVGRPSDDPAVLSRVARATREWFEEVPA